MFLGGLLNTENDYLLDDPSNWGVNGNLSTSDQFGIVFGNILYIGAMVFPFIVVIITERKYHIRHKTKATNKMFDKIYGVLYENLKTD